MSGRYFLRSVAENYNVSQRVPTCPGHGQGQRVPCPSPVREGHERTRLTANDHGEDLILRARMELACRFVVRDNPEAPGGKAAFPIYKGSKKNGTQVFTGRVAVVDKNSLTPLWRKSVVQAARPNGRPVVRVLDGPLVIRVLFTLRRPVSISEKKRPYPIVRPDVDNLTKPTYDAITASGLWKDDALIISQINSKAYVNGYHPDGTPALDEPGCVVEIFRVFPPSP